jgi:hypothetical protein
MPTLETKGSRTLTSCMPLQQKQRFDLALDSFYLDLQCMGLP